MLSSDSGVPLAFTLEPKTLPPAPPWRLSPWEPWAVGAQGEGASWVDPCPLRLASAKAQQAVLPGWVQAAESTDRGVKMRCGWKAGAGSPAISASTRDESLHVGCWGGAPKIPENNSLLTRPTGPHVIWPAPPVLSHFLPHHPLFLILQPQPSTSQHSLLRCFSLPLPGQLLPTVQRSLPRPPRDPGGAQCLPIAGPSPPSTRLQPCLYE